MTIIICQQINAKDLQKDFKHIYKKYQSDIKPNIGDSVQDMLWKDPYTYKIADIIIDYKENSCFVELESYQVNSNKQVHDVYDLAINSHGWIERIKD